MPALVDHYSTEIARNSDEEGESSYAEVDLTADLDYTGGYTEQGTHYELDYSSGWMYLGTSWDETYAALSEGGGNGDCCGGGNGDCCESDPPQITGISPDTGPYGEGGYIEIMGTGFDPTGCGCVASVSFGAVETVTDTQVNVYYDENASTGTYPIYLYTSEDLGSNMNTWFVITGDQTPSISYVKPAPPWPAGATFGFSIYGSGFGTSPGLQFSCCIDSFSIIDSSDGEIDGNVTVDAGAAGDTTNVSVTSNGYYGLGFLGGAGQSSTGSAYQVQLAGGAPPALTQSPATLNMSIGDSNKTISVSVSPSMTFTPQFSSPTLLGNSNSNCQADLTATGQQGTGTATAAVTAANPSQESPQNSCSGIFSVEVCSPAQASSPTDVIVPPQAILLQMFGETVGAYDGSTNIPELSVAWAGFNRFAYSGQTYLFNGVSTWQALIDSGNVADRGTPTNGQEPELDNAVAVFTGAGGDITGGATCYWSPTNTQMGAVQAAFQSQTTAFPSGTGAPTCWGAATYGAQIVWKTSMPNNLVPGYQSAPAFLFMRARPSSSRASRCADSVATPGGSKMTKLLFTIPIALTFAARTGAAQTNGDSAAVEHIRALQRELAPVNNEEYGRITPDFKESHLTEIRKSIQSEVLAALRVSDDADALGKLSQMLHSQIDPNNHFQEDSMVAHRVGIGGFTGVVVGYPLYYGSGVFPTTRVVIDGYRNTGGGYELAAETGIALENCGLVLTQLPSPRPNEAWFLAHGHLYGNQVYHEVARIYAFDGYQFKELWAPPEPLDHPDFKVLKGAVVVTYGGPELSNPKQPKLEGTVPLTVNGAVVTTRTIAP